MDQLRWLDRGVRFMFSWLRQRLPSKWNSSSPVQPLPLASPSQPPQQPRAPTQRRQRLPDKYGDRVAGHALANHALQTWDNVQHTRLNQAMDVMAARQMFPDIDSLLQDPGETTVLGGDMKNEVHLRREPTPKANPWPWIALIVLALVGALMWYLTTHPSMPASPTLTPGASKIGISVTPGS